MTTSFLRGRADARLGERGAPLPRRRLVFSLLAVLVLLGLGPLALVSWKLIDLNKEELKTSQQELQQVLARSMTGQVDGQMDLLSSQLLRLARALGPKVASRKAWEPEAIRATLARLDDEKVLYLTYRDLQGRSIDLLPSTGLLTDLDRLLSAGLRQTAERLADGPSGESTPVVFSEPVILSGPPRTTMSMVSAPVIYRGAFRGVVFAMVDVGSIWESAAAQRRAYTVLLLGRSGRPFASSDPRWLDLADEFEETELVESFVDSEGRASATLPFRHRNVRYLGSYERTRQNWGVVILARERDVYRPVRAMMASTLQWALVALGLALVGAAFFARTLSKPIQRLAEVSRRFAEGDFSVRVSLRSRNEIGELAEVFNRMATRIEENIRSLKKAAAEQNELLLGTIRALTEAIDAKDPYTRGHSVRVNKYSVAIARELGLSKREIRDIHLASLLHDVGKIGIEDSILNKEAALTAEEFERMKEHPVRGAEIMAPIRQMAKMIPGLRYHHERMNGKGYPDGLAGEEIPLMARIIAVADTYDAMTTRRPYQEPFTPEAAVARINELKDVALDPRVVEAFNRAFDSGELREIQERGTDGPARRAPAVAGA